MDTKRCTKCGEEKPLDAFSKGKELCKVCESARGKAWREANLEKARAKCKAWREANLEKARARSKAWREANLEKARAKCKAWREANPEKVSASHKAKSKAEAETLCDSYVRKTLRIHLADCTPELIQAKREQLLLHRTITNLKKEIANV